MGHRGTRGRDTSFDAPTGVGNRMQAMRLSRIACGVVVAVWVIPRAPEMARIRSFTSLNTREQR
jgi:hypothetical protein